MNGQPIRILLADDHAMLRSGMRAIFETQPDLECVAEVADGIHQLTTYIPEADFSFNQYLVTGDEPLLFHTGGRQLFPLVSEAISKVVMLAGGASVLGVPLETIYRGVLPFVVVQILALLIITYWPELSLILTRAI